MVNSSVTYLTEAIRNVPDFPKKGIVFRDITTLLKDKKAFQHTIDLLVERYRTTHIDKIAGIESRGFIFGGALAYALQCGFVPIRKPKKLPAETYSVSYDLEYGTDTLEMHRDAIAKGERVLLVDDLLATGGTMQAACSLVERCEAEVVGISFLIELSFLNGRKKLPERDIFSIISYDAE